MVLRPPLLPPEEPFLHSSSPTPGQPVNAPTPNQEMIDFALEKARSQFQRDETWLDTIAGIRVNVARLLALLGYLIIVLGALLIGYLVVFIVIHYTIPQLDWLGIDNLRRLEGFYSRVALVATPVILVSNAWLIWWYSRPRFETNRAE